MTKSQLHLSLTAGTAISHVTPSREPIDQRNNESLPGARNLDAMPTLNDSDPSVTLLKKSSASDNPSQYLAPGQKSRPANFPLDRLLNQDCIAGLQALPAGSVDLAFADPPFNIGYDYDVYQDRQEHAAYLDWSRRWIAAVHHALKPTGTFWLAIGDEYAAELKLISQEIGFACRSWVVWYYTFGVNCKRKFTRSHAHLFHFVKDPDNFTFLAEELENRIPSARQLVYNDARGNPQGRLPDDTWILRPQDLTDGFEPHEDSWYFPRIAGTHKQREGFHGCQMPEQLLGRIIRVCSQIGDLVLDPFSGSGTTLVTAKKLRRHYLGYDISSDYIKHALQRLLQTKLGEPLDGDAEPKMSAPATLEKQPGLKKYRDQAYFPTADVAERMQGVEFTESWERGLLEAFAQSYGGHSVDRLIADAALNAAFLAACDKLGLAGDARSWNKALLRLRKAKRLVDYPARERSDIAWKTCDNSWHASEIAWQLLTENQPRLAIEDILCDPVLAAEFDALGQRYAPRAAALALRWGAIKLRKISKLARLQALVLSPGLLRGGIPLAEIATSPTITAAIPTTAGVYRIFTKDNTTLWIGGTFDMRNRLRLHAATAEFLTPAGEPADLHAQFFATEPQIKNLLGYQARLVQKLSPRLNLRHLWVRE
ncbi:MAG: DNA methyltransferase [Pirellulales bacterium]|nr:DNA methyltransferase [Pirellulales bacterium]